MAVAVAPEPTEVFNWPFRVEIVPLEVDGTSRRWNARPPRAS